MTQNKKQENHNKVSSRPILYVLIGLGFLTIIILVSMLTASNDMGLSNSSKTADAQEKDKSVQSQDASEDSALFVVKAIDPDKKLIQLYDINKQELIVLGFSGGTNITDKYGQITSMNQVEIGSMVDVTYRKNKRKLINMSISNKAWEYAGVSNLSIDRSANIMKIADNKYKYNKDIFILDQSEFIPVTNLTEQDELIVRGYEETIWSITVTRGHGTVVLQDCENFIGDNITIGYESMQRIEEDMEITVREGNFNLTVENAEFSATKNITVNHNKITYVTLSDLGPDLKAKGMINFEITPFGADLFVDKILTSYANPVKLDYGDHQIKVSLGGYTTYEGILTVDSAGKSFNIDLPETTSEEEATVTETETDVTDPTDTTEENDTTDTTEENDTTDTVQDIPADYSALDPEDIDEKHKIYVQEPEGTSVYLDGSYMCKAPGSFKKIVGTHVITFIKEGYETMSYTVEVSDDNLDTYFKFPNLTKK